MAVTSIKEYIGEPRDSVGHFHGNQLLFVSWDRHLLFAAPFLLYVSPEARFGDVVSGPLAALLQPDPDSASIDWSRVEWLKSNQPWTPDFERTLAENGIGHKDQLRFRTPGPNTLFDAA